ncbi:hypothetical protein, partial [[Acholeplasma] multilocale]|uniref:hypothetical protein n=1 Tax=[Acholeplasma] multilocale TaxID=264638 RepID=UPI00047C5740
MKNPIITKSFSDKKYKVFGFTIIDLIYAGLSLSIGVVTAIISFDNILLKGILSIVFSGILLLGLIPTSTGKPFYLSLKTIFWKASVKNKYNSIEAVSTLIPFYTYEKDYLISQDNFKSIAFLVNGIDLSIMSESEVRIKIQLFEQWIKNVDVDMCQIKVDVKVKLEKYKDWLDQQKKKTRNNLSAAQLIDYKNQIKEKEKEYDSQFYLVFSSDSEEKLINQEMNIKNFFSKMELTYQKLNSLEFTNLIKDMYFDLDKDDLTEKELKSNKNSLDKLLSYSKLKFKNSYVIASDKKDIKYLSLNTIEDYPTIPNLEWFFAISVQKGTVISKIKQIKQSEVIKKINRANTKAKVNRKTNNNFKLTSIIEEEADLDSIEELAMNIKLG